jgi:2-iminobutanoate/2-iminopropanoate deaminase
MSHHRHAVAAEGAPAALGPYSHAIRAGGFLFCSGQLGLDPATGELVDGGVAAQARRALENLVAVCEAAGTTLADAVRVTVYLADMADFATVNEIYAEFFPADPPARTAFQVAALPKDGAVELDAIVALPG